jgi:integrase
MLKDFVGPAATRRLQSWIPGDHTESFCVRLVELGYAHTTIRHKLWTVSIAARWMVSKQLSMVELSERRIEQFRDMRRRRGRTCRGLCATLLLLLEHLRSAGVVPTPERADSESPMDALLARYEEYLRHERALAETTIAGYLPFAHACLVEHLDGGAAPPSSLRAKDVRGFLLARVRCMAPRRAQFMGTALRSFLRYLFLCGETRTDLSLSLPTVRQWRLSSVPRHLPTRDVERLLRACNRSSGSGRRDHAILLLLARLGFRASEIVTLELGDLRWREGEIIVCGKGSRRDRLPLFPKLARRSPCT